MRRRIVPVLIVVLVLAGIFCGVQIYQTLGQIAGRNQTTQWELEKGSIVNLENLDGETVGKAANEENTLQCLFYRQEQQEIITNKDLNRTTQATVIALYGNSSLLFDGTYPLTPNAPDECLISKQTALALFGDSDVYDTIITWQDKDYRVKGVLPESELPLFIVETDKPSDTFSYLYCKQFNPLLGEETMNAYFLANNINASKDAMNIGQKHLASLITKENTYYEILFLRNLKDIVTLSHVLVFLALLTGILVFSMWRQYRGKRICLSENISSSPNEI